jgi:hypothetical protein
MDRALKNLHKTLDSVAEHNEAAALEVMRATEKIHDEPMRQKLLSVIHHLNHDADELRLVRDDVQRVKRLG